MTQNTHARLARELNFTSDGKVPDWIMLVPAGDQVEGRDGRTWTNPNPDQVVSRYVADGGEVVLDYEHATELAPHEPNPAAGWIDQVENREGAIWGHVNWTERARNMIANKEYRFISPVFTFHKDTREIVSLVSAALTHSPNLDMPALNKRRHGQSGEPENPETTETTMDKQTRIALCAKLGLANEASDQAIMDAVNALQESEQKALNSANQPSLEKFVPRADHDELKGKYETAQNKLKKLEEDEIEALVDGAIKAGKIAPASKDYHLAACKNDRAAFEKFIEGAPKQEITKDSDLDERDAPSGGELSAEEKAMCAAMGISEEDMKNESLAKS